jgi:2-keto-4-pentenoate hydratase
MIPMEALALQIFDAFSAGGPIAPPPGLSIEQAYAVETELQRLRAVEGHRVVGRKVGYANKAVWRVLKLDTLVWASMYDDTVVMTDGEAEWQPRGYSLKIEPEIVVKLKGDVARHADAAVVLHSVEWMALGFEIIDCPYPDWKFTPADFVAAFGLHRKLFVGTPITDVSHLVEELASFRVKLLRNGELVEEGAGKNSLRSPALCVAELGGKAGEMISTGTLTSGSPIAPGGTWRAECDILPVPALTLRLL